MACPLSMVRVLSMLRLICGFCVIATTSGFASAAQVIVEEARPSCCADEEPAAPSDEHDQGCPPSCLACPRPLSLIPVLAPVVLEASALQAVAPPREEIASMPGDPPCRAVFHPPRESR